MTSLPKTPIKGDPETRRFLEAVRQYLTTVGKDALTVQDLKDIGFWDRNGITVPGTSTGTEEVVAAPTVPFNLTTSGAFENIILEWEYTEYAGHAWTRIYRSETNLFANAVVVANVNAKIYADPVGPGRTYYYWVTNVNKKGVESAPNATAGTQGQTAQDVGYILSILNGAITESQLYQTLGARINLIDAASSVPGSVNARLTSVQNTLQTQITANGSAIVTLQQTDATQATQITALGTRVGSAESNITNLQSTTSSQATSLSSLTTRVGSAESNITNLQSTTSSQATQITNLTSTVNGYSTSIQTLQTTTNGLSAQYTVKIDNNGYVSGFGLASTATTATPTSSFIVRADRFAIASPSGPGVSPATPFTVLTTAQYINGVLVQPGVYITNASIMDGAITNAKIGNAVIDNTKIANAAIATANIADGAITNAKIADASITRAKIQSLSVTTADIDNAAITSAKIADAAVQRLKIAGNAVTQPINYTTSDVTVTSNATLSSGGYGYYFVGIDNGSYEYEPQIGYYYVGPYMGSYEYQYQPPGMSGGQTVLETGFITVGDSIGGSLMVVFYGFVDASAVTDAGQLIGLYADTGGGYQSIGVTQTGATTSSGNTRSVIPCVLAKTLSGVQQVRLKVVAGRALVGSSGVYANSTLRNITLSALGAAR